MERTFPDLGAAACKDPRGRVLAQGQLSAPGWLCEFGLSFPTCTMGDTPPVWLWQGFTGGNLHPAPTGEATVGTWLGAGASAQILE